MNQEFVSHKKPLSRSITLGCIGFILALCILMGLMSYYSYRNALYSRYRAYITDILNYVDRHIDDEDLANCTETLTPSAKYDELLAFMDGVMEDFSIHYLYIFKPLPDRVHLLSIIDAQTYYKRNVDTEGNLYLGWTSDDEYAPEDVEALADILENEKDIVFTEETTEWGTDYTGILPLRTENDIPYALLAVDVDISEIKTMIRLRTMEFAVIIIIIGALFTILFLLWARKNISQPLKLLEESAVAYARKSHGKRDVNELTFDAPEIHTQNEVESLSLAVKQMTLDIQDYVQSILEAERRAAQMSDLANKDALTGIRNKTAYDKEVEKITWRLEREPGTPYGIAIIDLNFLKKTNDTYGHDKGNISIVKLSRMVCSAFAHSPVFRIGGDEFAVILMDHDLQHIEELKTALEEALRISAESEDMEPWERISAAIGYAVFDAERDHEVEDVFRRADENMYTRKKEMKAARE